jgi:hypothetical protein
MLKIFIPSLLLLLVFACNKPSGSQKEMAEEFMKEAVETGPTEYSQQTAVGIMYDVTNVGVWQRTYDEFTDSAARIGFMTNRDYPNNLFVFEWTADHESARKRLNSEEMKSFMRDAGITTDPIVVYYDIKRFEDTTVSDKLRLAIGVEIKDYDVWEDYFDGEEPTRNQAGLTLLGLATDAMNPKQVYMIFSAADYDQVIQMTKTDEYKQVLAESGVIGDPVLTWWIAP